MFKVGLVALAVFVGLVFGGCITPDKNKAPSVAQVDCPEIAKVGDKVNISVVAYDPDGDRIAYQVAFGDGVQSEWSGLLVSGVAKTFLHTYNEPGEYGISGIASDQHHKNSGWSDVVTIKVLPRPPPIGPERVMFCVGPGDDFAKIVAMGITIIQSYELPYIDDLDFLNRAHDQGLKVYYSIACMVHNTLLATGTWNRNDVAEVIARVKNHPALYCWQPVEEANLWNRDISFDQQKDIYNFFKIRDPNHPVTQTLAGGTSDWDKINFEAMDFLTPDTYVYDGSGEMWGLKPLAYLAEVGRQERTYLDNKGITKPVMFIMQCCNEPELSYAPLTGNDLGPLGNIENQFNTLEPYDVFTLGMGWWAWNHNYFGPCTSDEMYGEMKEFMQKIKRGVK